MQTGKLTNEQLDRLIFSKLKSTRAETVTGPGVGRDCAVADLGENYLVLSTDPITGTEKGIGRLCVNISCNDVAAAGGEPVAILVTMLIPPRAQMAQVEEVVDDVIAACAQNNVDLIGGHTEVSGAVNRFVLSGVCIGKKAKTPFPPLAPGDFLVMSKSAGLEGTGILAAEKETALRGVLTAQELSEAADYLHHTSVIAEGRAGVAAGVSLMHDATEGGVLGGAWEMADCAGLGVQIDADAIPVSTLTRKLCAHLRINPLRLISSGVMLFATSEPDRLLRLLKEAQIPGAVIGRFTPSGMTLRHGGKEETLAPPQSDELYRALEG